MLTINSWLHTWWLRVPEPRIYSFLYAGAYFVSILGGVLTAMFPPQTLLGLVGQGTMQLMGILMVVGGIIGAIGGTREAWKFERIGIYSILLGLGAYLWIVSHLAIFASGSRFAQLTAIVLAVILFLVRLAMIWRYTYRPRG